MAYTYGPFTVLTSAGALAPAGTSGAVYDVSDTSYATPLTVTPDGGSPTTSLTVSAQPGVITAFTHATLETLMFKSGTLPAMPLVSHTDIATALQPGEPGTTVHAVVWDGAEYPTQPATLPGVVLRIAVGPSDPAFTPISGVQDLWIPADI